MISILATLAAHYAGARCSTDALRRYFVDYLSAVYAKASERAEVRADFSDVTDPETRARYEGSMVALVSLCVEHPRFAREVRRRLPDLERLCAFLARNEGAGRPVRSPPAHRVEHDTEGPILVPASEADNGDPNPGR